MLNKRLKNHIGYSGETLEILLKMPYDHQEYLADKYDKFNEDIYLRIDREILRNPKKIPRQVIKEWLGATHAPCISRQKKYILEEYEKRKYKEL